MAARSCQACCRKAAVDASGPAGDAAALDGHQARLRRGLELYRRLERHAAELPRAVGADLRANYVAFKTADDYPSSIDMATALHPQTLLATQYGGDTLADPFGYPVRLRMATKLGYKNPKWVTAIEVTNTYTGGYWEKLGFPWFGGI